jgi:hypothetical protein
MRNVQRVQVLAGDVDVEGIFTPKLHCCRRYTFLIHTRFQDYMKNDK